MFVWADMAVLAASITVFLGAMVLGALTGKQNNRFAAADACVGLGAASGTVTVLATRPSINLSTWAAILGLCAVAAVCWCLWARRGCGGRGQWLTLGVFLPLLVIIARGEPTHWDEIAHWLPNAAYLYRYDSFPRSDLPLSPSQFPGYPYASSLFVDFVSLLAGRFAPSAGGLLNVLLLSTCVPALICLVSETQRMRANRPEFSLSGVDVAALVGAGSALVSLLSPTFDRDFTFSSLPDTATAVTVAMCAALCWLTLEQLRSDQWLAARGLALRLGLAASLLVNLKQPNIVLLALLSSAYLLVAFRDPRTSVRKAMRLLPAMLVPPLIVWGAWRVHIATNMAVGEKGILPMVEWHTDLLPEIFTAIWRHILAHPIHFMLTIGLSLAAIARQWQTQVGIDRLLIIVVVPCVGYTCFLLISYILIFNSDEARVAAAYWRYSTHYGLSGTFAAVVFVVWWWRRPPVGRSLRAAALATLVFLPMAAIYLGNRMVTDQDDEVFYCRRIALDLARDLPHGAHLAILNATSAGYCASFVQYEISRPGEEDHDLRVCWQANLWSTPQPEGLRRAAASFGDSSITHILAINPTKDYAEALGIDLKEDGAFLLQRLRDKWGVIRSWPTELH